MSPLETTMFALGGFLLAVIALTLIVLIILQLRRQRESAVTAAIDAAIQRLDAAVKHHVEVNAVLALTEQFNDKPELLDNLTEYSRQVVAAALTHRIDALGKDIKTAQDQLSEQHFSLTRGDVFQKAAIARIKEMIASMEEDLLVLHDKLSEFLYQRSSH